MVELALLLPVLVILLLCIIDFSRAILAKNTLTNLSREGANLATRTRLDPEEIMTSLATTAKPLKMSENGMMCITEVKKSGGTITVTGRSWSKSAGPGSRVLGNGSNLEDFLGKVKVGEGETKFIFEAGYVLKNPLILPSTLPQLYCATVF